MEVAGRVIRGTQFRIAVSSNSDIGQCRRTAKQLADSVGFDEVTTGKICIIATELATNIVRHAVHGEMLIQLLEDEAASTLELLAVDKGPGMHDVDACLRDGFSTSGTAGEGLGAVARLSGMFDLFSRPGQGTVIASRTERQAASPSPSLPRPGSRLQLGAINIPVAGETECGDTWRVAERGSSVSLLVADGLGHGPLAAAASQAAAKAFSMRPFDAPALAMQDYHRALAGSRGAAAACAQWDNAALKITYAGVGNISASILTQDRSQGMMSHYGTLGLQLPRAQQFGYDCSPQSVVVMHSDGLSARWNLSQYPGLFQRHPAVIAGVLYRDFARGRDDSTVIVACHRT